MTILRLYHPECAEPGCDCRAARRIREFDCFDLAHAHYQHPEYLCLTHYREHLERAHALGVRLRSDPVPAGGVPVDDALPGDPYEALASTATLAVAMLPAWLLGEVEEAIGDRRRLLRELAGVTEVVSVLQLPPRVEVPVEG